MGVAYGPVATADSSMIICLDARNVKSYPGSGTTWYDLSGKGNHGTLINGPTYNSAGYFGFDAVDDQLNGAKPTVSQFTIELHVQLLSISSSTYPWILRFGGSDFIGFHGSSTSAVTFRASLYSGSYAEINSDTHNAGASINVYHLTYDATTVRMYRNGVLQASTMNIGPPNACTEATYYLSYAPGYDKAQFNISMLKMYSRVLTAQEIQQNFNAIRGRYGL